MKRKLLLLGCIVLGLCCAGCGHESEIPEDYQQTAETLKPEEIKEDVIATTTEKTTETNTSEKAETDEKETIQDELARIELKSLEFENADWDNMPQQEMNQLTGQWYMLWDEELNSLWGRLSDELDAQKKKEVLEEQRAWIKRKEMHVRGEGFSAYGGSLQPQIENTVAEEMTRVRAYILAEYLAAVRNEEFVMPSEIRENMDNVDPCLNDIFEKFEGQWIFDDSRGACVGVERSETCAYGVEGSNWTLWDTGGDIISDLDVYGYAENRILFKVPHDDFDSYYELAFFNWEDALYFAYGTSLDAMDDVIYFE